jgi:hypothetical protein
MQCSAKTAFTVPIANVQILRQAEVHPNGGIWEPYPFLLGKEPKIYSASWSVWLDALLPAAEAVLSMTPWLDIEE